MWLVRLNDQEILKSASFRYLRDWEIDDDVNHRIRAEWVKWRSAIWVLCDRRILIKIRIKFYKAAIRLYVTECWAIKKKPIHKISVAEMRMLKWISGNARQENFFKKKKQEICLKIRVAPIDEKRIDGESLEMIWPCLKKID